MKPKHISFDLALGYALSGIFFAFGVVVILDLIIPEYVPKQFRITLGIVLLLWGMYRFVLTRMKNKQLNADSS